MDEPGLTDEDRQRIEEFVETSYFDRSPDDLRPEGERRDAGEG